MAGFKVWVPGEEVVAADMNGFLQTQTVPVFTTTAQRDTQWPAPPVGALCRVTANGATYHRTATTWRYAHLPPTVYTPVLSSTGTAPVAGSDGIRQGRFTIIWGRCFYKVIWMFGTAGGGASGGTGTYRLEFPTAAPIVATGGPNPYEVVGDGHLQSGPGQTHYNVSLLWISGTQMAEIYSPVQWSAGSPNPISFSNILYVTGDYETTA